MNCIMIVSSVCSSLTPAAQDIGIAYGFTTGHANLCSISFSYTYPFMALFSIWAYAEVRPSLILRLAAVNLFVSGWFRQL